MNETDRDLVFSESVKAGKRIYYFDVKQSRSGDRFIAITESKKINEGTYENPRFVFEKHKIFLYKEDYQKFVGALMKTLDVARTGIVPEAEEVPEAVNASSEQVAPQPAPQPVTTPEAEAATVQPAPEPISVQPAPEPATPAEDAQPAEEVRKPKKGWFSW